MKHFSIQKLRRGMEFFCFTAPALAFVLYATNIPFLLNMVYSLYEWNGVGREMRFVGLSNFIRIFTADAAFGSAWLFTLRYAAFYVVAVNLLALGIALALTRATRINAFCRAFYYIPYIIGLTALSLIWKFIFGPGFEALYAVTGWELFRWSWVGTPKLAFYVVLLMSVWKNVGFYMVNYVAGLLAVPDTIVEAARIDGAGPWQLLRRIRLPLIFPAISICTLHSLMFSFKLFDIIMVFTKGGPANSTVSVAYDIYKEAFGRSNYGMATAKSLVFFVAVLGVTLLQLKVSGAREVEE